MRRSNAKSMTSDVDELPTRARARAAFARSRVMVTLSLPILVILPSGHTLRRAADRLRAGDGGPGFLRLTTYNVVDVAVAGRGDAAGWVDRHRLTSSTSVPSPGQGEVRLGVERI